MGKPTFDPTQLTTDDIHPAQRTATPVTSGDDSGESFLGNVAKSGANFANNLLGAVTSPIQTYHAMTDVVDGYLAKIPGIHTGAQQTAAADAMTKHFKDRYGSVANVRKTAYEDPVGFAADLSTVIAPFAGGAGAAGEIADMAGMAKTAAALRTVAKAGTTAAEVTNPLNVGKAVSAGVRGVGGVMAGAGLDAGSAVTRAGEYMQNPIANTGQALAKKLYRTTLQPSGTAAEGAAKVDTLMKEGVGPAGEQPAWDKISEYANQVKQMFNDPRAAGLNADPINVLKGVDPLLANQGRQSWVDQLAPMNGPDKVRSVVDDFVQKHFNPGTPAGQPTPSGVLDPSGNMIMTPGSAATPATAKPLPLDTLQGEKQNTYARLKDSDFGGGGVTSPIPAAERQAQVGLASGARNEIGDQLASVGITGVHAIHAAEGGLLDAMPDLQRNAAKMANGGMFTTTKEALIRHVLPMAAIQLYKLGKLPMETVDHIVKQGATAGAQQQSADN